MTQFNAYEGTVSELVAKGVTINGQAVDQVMLSVLGRLKIAKEIGSAEKVAGKRGKVAKIFKLQGKPGFVVDVSAPEATAQQA